MRLFTNERVVSGVVWGAMYIPAFFVPPLVSIAVGISMVKDFCKNNAKIDICSKYCSVPLDEAAQRNTYSDVYLSHLRDGGIMLLGLLFFCGIPYSVYSYLEPYFCRDTLPLNERRSLLPRTTHDGLGRNCAALFRNFKNRVLPMPSDRFEQFLGYALVGAVISMGSFVIWLFNAPGVSANLQHVNGERVCNYSNASKDERSLVVDLDVNVFFAESAIQLFSIILSFIVPCIVFPVTKGIVACSKRLMHHDTNTQVAAGSIQENSGDDTDDSAAVRLAGF